MSNLSPFAYFGGKWRIFQSLTKYIPPVSEVDCYVEPFFGSGTLFFNYARLGKNEIVNDFDSQLYNFYKVMQDRRKYNELIRLLKHTPYSRQMFIEARTLIKKNKASVSDVRKAWAVYLLYTMSVMNNKVSFSRGSLHVPEGRNFINDMRRLDHCARRMQTCLIENENALLTCQRNDSRKTFIYLDPPYLNVKDSAVLKKTYNVMSEDEHRKLLEFCIEAKSKILISGYHSDLYNEMLQGWNVEEVKSFTTTVANKRGNSAHSKTTEVLWSNFQIPNQIRMF